MNLFIPPLFAAFLCLFFSLPVRRLSFAIGAVDLPGARHIHRVPTPRAGGLALGAAFLLSLFLFLPDLTSVGVWFAPAFLTLALGLTDDVAPLPAGWKLTAEAVIFSLFPLFGIFPRSLLLLPGVSLPLSPSASGIFTILFLLSVANAFNMIDGMDGLAAGYGLAAAGGIFCSALFRSSADAARLSGLLTGVFAGFYPSNRHPARLFLGDSGSLCGGLLLGASLLSLFPGEFPLLPVLGFLLLPATDLSFSVFRRLRAGKNPMTADDGHLHHRLLRQGCGYRKTVSILHLYGALGIFSACLLLLLFS